MKPVLLINPNSSERTTEDMLAIVRQHLPDVRGWTNVYAPRMITAPEALLAAAEQIAMSVLPPARAVIVAAFGDPGATALEKTLNVPVIGIGAASARAARQGGSAFAVVTTTPKLAPAIDALMQAQGAGYLGCFLTDGEPEELLTDQARLDAALINACNVAAKAGAQRIIIGGGPLATAAIRIAKHVPVPLVQPLVAACQEVVARTGHSAPPAPDESQ